MMGHSASHVLTAEIIGHVKFESSDLFFFEKSVGNTDAFQYRGPRDWSGH